MHEIRKARQTALEMLFTCEVGVGRYNPVVGDLRSEVNGHVMSIGRSLGTIDFVEDARDQILQEFSSELMAESDIPKTEGILCSRKPNGARHFKNIDRVCIDRQKSALGGSFQFSRPRLCGPFIFSPSR